MNNVKFSVVIPVYKAEKYIAKSVQSVLDQSYSNYELLVVDNGSPDKSANIVEEIIGKNKDKCIRLITLSVNQGISGGRNAGINEATGDFVCFLDADDFWYSNKLEMTQVAISNNTDCDVFWHWEYHINDNEKKLVKYRDISQKDQYQDLLYNNNCLSTSATIVSKKALKNVGGFDITMRSGEEDYDCWLRLAKEGYKFHRICEPLGAFMIHGESFSSKYLQHCYGVITMLEKHYLYMSSIKNNSRKIERDFRRKKAECLCSCARRMSLCGDRTEAYKTFIEAIQCDAKYCKSYVGIALNTLHI